MMTTAKRARQFCSSMRSNHEPLKMNKNNMIAIAPAKV